MSLATNQLPSTKQKSSTIIVSDGNTNGDSQNNSTPNQAQDEEDEAKLIEALRQLDDMHNKLINLRRSIPRMMQPINSAPSYSSPEKLFDEFSKRTLKASEDVVQFTTQWVENKWIFDRATASRNEDGEGIKRWKMSQVKPAYLSTEETSLNNNDDTVEKVDKIKETKKQQLVPEGKRKLGEGDMDIHMEDAEATGGIVRSEEERKQMIDNFKKEHDDCIIDYNPDKNEIKITLPSPPSIAFTIECVKSSSTLGGYRYIVSTPNTSFLHIAILRSITTRPNSGNLKFLLDMMYQYTTIYSARCEKCTYLTGGPRAELPVVRRLVKSVKLVKRATMASSTSTATAASLPSSSVDANMTNNSTDSTSIKKEDKEDVKNDNDKDNKSLKIEGGNNASDGDIVMKDEAAAAVAVTTIASEDKKAKREDSNSNEIGEKKDNGDDEEVEVVEERWIAYHESCLD